jgi:hypothetical protein
MANAERLAELRENLVKHFDLEEFRTLCFDLDVNYDDLRGEGITAKARELVALLNRRDRIPVLIAHCAKRRPNVNWQGIPLPVPPSPVKLVPDKPLHIFQVQMADRHAEEGRMLPPLESFPAGTREVFLVFRYANMPPGQSLSANVYDSAARQVAEWSDHYEEPAGVNSCLLPALSGEFAPGDYRVEIRAADQLVGEARFTVQAPEAKVAPARPLRVFLCYSSDDMTAVRALYRRLRTDGVEPWLDEEDLLAGQKPQEEIPRAVRASDVVIICLSKRAVTITGSIQKEMQYVLDVAEEQPEGTSLVIPLRLEECRVPDRLRQRRPVDYFKRGGYERLLQALRKRAEDVGATIEERAKNIEQQDVVLFTQTAPSGISARDINVTFGDGTIITGAEQVILNQLLRGKLAASEETLVEIISLKRQLERLKSNLLSIQEKRAEFVDPHSAPPDLEEAERRTREEIARIESRLAELKAE